MKPTPPIDAPPEEPIEAPFDEQTRASTDEAAARPMTDDEARLTDRLTHDLEQALGEGIIVGDVEIDADQRTTVQLACLVEGQVRAVEVSGDTPQDAYREAMKAAAELRLAGAWWQIVGPS